MNESRSGSLARRGINGELAHALTAVLAPRGVQAALALLVGLGRIEIVPLVRQLVLAQGRRPARASLQWKSGLTLSAPKFSSCDTMSRPARFGFCTLRSAVIQTVGASSFMPRWNGSSFITALNFFRPVLVLRRRDRAVNRVAMRRRHPRQKGFQVQLQPRAQFLRVLVSRGPIVAVIDPEHRNVRLRLDGEVQDDGLVRTEIRRDDGAAAALGRWPSERSRAAIWRAARRSSG